MATSTDAEDVEEPREERRIRELESLVDLMIRAHYARTRYEIHMQELENNDHPGCALCYRRALALMRGTEFGRLPSFCALMTGWEETISEARKASKEFNGGWKW